MDTACTSSEEVAEPAVRLVHQAFDPGAVLAAVRTPAAGGNILFLGTARANTDGMLTTRLEYEAHELLAVAVLGRLRDEAVARFGLVGCSIVHRLGLVEPGDASIAVAVSSPHRREAFAAGEWLMNRIKREAPIWKREHRPDGTAEWSHGDEPPDTGGRE